MAVSRLTPRPGPPRSPSLGELLDRLGGGVLTLVDQTLELMVFELKGQMAELLRRMAMLAFGGAVAVIGVACLFASLALWSGERLGTLPGGFALVGGAVTLAGVVLLIAFVRRLRQQRLIPPATAAEIRRDVAWIKNTR